MREIEMFLIRQQEMRQSHQEQVERLSERKVSTPSTPPVVVDNDRHIAEIRRHIAELRGDLPRVVGVAKRMQGEIKQYGVIFDRHNI